VVATEGSFCQYLKIQKNTKTQKYKIRTASFGKYKGLALWLIFEFVLSLYFVFCKFWVRIFLLYQFCIFEIVD